MIALNDEQVEKLALMQRHNADGFAVLLAALAANKINDTALAISRNSDERDEMSGRAQVWGELEATLSEVQAVYEDRVNQSRQVETRSGADSEPWLPVWMR
jgi:hypothetical protein